MSVHAVPPNPIPPPHHFLWGRGGESEVEGGWLTPLSRLLNPRLGWLGGSPGAGAHCGCTSQQHKARQVIKLWRWQRPLFGSSIPAGATRWLSCHRMSSAKRRLGHRLGCRRLAGLYSQSHVKRPDTSASARPAMGRTHSKERHRASVKGLTRFKRGPKQVHAGAHAGELQEHRAQ
jgi:hypothetical protein